MQTTSNIIAENMALKAQIEDLKRQIKNFQTLIFGSKSERHILNDKLDNPKQLLLNFEESCIYSEEDPATECEGDSKLEKNPRGGKPFKKKKKKKKGGNKLIFPEDLEVQEMTLDLPEDEKSDPITGKKFTQIGTESIDKLIRLKASYKILRLIRPVYGARENGVVKMDLPVSLAGFSKLDDSFWAECFTRRVCDHLPFYRQVQILRRDGINVSRQHLDKTYIKVANTMRILWELLKQVILSFPAVNIDETVINMQIPGKKSLHKSYLWVLAGRPPNCKKEPLVWMDFETNRRHENAEKLLENYSKIVHSDAFQAYEKLADAKQYIWAPCWVHARRKFIKGTDCQFQRDAIQRFTHIMKLDNGGDDLIGQDRINYRTQHVAKKVDDLITFLEKGLLTQQVIVSKSLSNACAYFLKRKNHFKAFLSHADAEMDNNSAERSIRPLKIGNKNWLFIGSQSGGEACAIMTSLLQSAKNIGLNPQEYLENILRRIPYTQEKDLCELLPHKWEKKINSRSPFLPPDYKVY